MLVFNKIIFGSLKGVTHMSILRIRIDEDPVLRKKTKEVKSFDDSIKKLIDNMIETMYDAPGVGLAAPQVGVSKKIVIVDVDDGQGLQVLVNPRIIKIEGEEEEGLEGCLSVPGIYGMVKRQLLITVKALNKKGKGITFDATGFRARAIQHEMDHLNGIIFTDKATKLRKVADETEEQIDDDKLFSIIEEVREKKNSEIEEVKEIKTSEIVRIE
jgi:peptide deformylase